MHLENTLESNEASEEKKRPVVRQTRSTSSQIELTREELDAIYARTPDPVKKNRTPVTVRAKAQPAADDKWTAPVSYTHLDVYKRQVSYIYLIRVFMSLYC